VDALPEMAPKWRRNRPGSRFFNYSVTDHAGTLEPFFRVEGEGSEPRALAGFADARLIRR